MPFKHTFFPWRIIWLIVCPVVFVQFFINNLIKKLFPSCVNLHSERFFREARPRFSVPWRMRGNIILNHTTCWRDLGSVLGAHAREKSLGTRLFHMSFLAVGVLYQKEIKSFGYFFYTPNSTLYQLWAKSMIWAVWPPAWFSRRHTLNFWVIFNFLGFWEN